MGSKSAGWVLKGTSFGEGRLGKGQVMINCFYSPLWIHFLSIVLGLVQVVESSPVLWELLLWGAIHCFPGYLSLLSSFASLKFVYVIISP